MKKPITSAMLGLSIFGILYAGSASLPKREPMRPAWAAPSPVDRKVATPAQSAGDSVPADQLTGMLSNFDGDKPSSAFGSGWQAIKDDRMGGNSTVAMSVVDGGAGGTPKSLHVVSDLKDGSPYPYAGAMLFFGKEPMRAVNLSSKQGLTFQAKGRGQLRLYLFATSLGNIPAQTTVELKPGWTPVAIPWRELGADGSDVQAVLLSGSDLGVTDFQIDEMRLQ